MAGRSIGREKSLLSLTVIEAGMDGYGFVVRKEIDCEQKSAYVIERSYLYLNEDDEETWGTERHLFDSWAELIDSKGTHLFTLPPVLIHSSYRETLQSELSRHYNRQSRAGIHPYWRAFLGICDESFLPNIER
jgi:hypothetical protein